MSLFNTQTDPLTGRARFSVPTDRPTRGGTTFDPALDAERLAGQHAKVLGIMRDGNWRTLYQLEQLTGIPTQSISARLRDFRKRKFGAYTVERRRVSDGTWEYRVTASERSGG